MASLNQVELSILLLLRDNTFDYKNYMPVDAVGRSFSPPLDQGVVRVAAEHLIQEQFSETDGRNRYRVTHLGSEIARITLENRASSTSMKPVMPLLTRSHWQFEDHPSAGLRRQAGKPVDWQNWGAIGTMIGIPLAILLAWL